MTEVKRNDEQDRYEAHVDGQAVGFCKYEDDGKTVTFTHTAVEPAYEGQGVGSDLAKFALDDCRSANRKIIPACAFIRAYIETHDAYKALVAIS